MMIGLLVGGVAQSQPSFGPAAVPQNAYPGDQVFVPLMGGGFCSSATLDPARPPQIRQTHHFVSPEGVVQDTYQYAISYWLREPEDLICGLAPPPPTFYVDVGALPLGAHTFEVTGFLGNEPIHSYLSSGPWVRQHTGLPNEISGLWYDPTQGGRGLNVMKLASGVIVLIWYTHDQHGEPLWLVHHATAGFDVTAIAGIAISTPGAPLAPGPCEAEQEPWGEIVLTYLGCGRATLAWTPLDPAIAPGSQSLFKLAQNVDATLCAPPADARAVWVNTP
jgi:hypothetical protein